MIEELKHLARDAEGHYLTSEENNLRGRVEFVDDLLKRLNAYLMQGRPIHPASEAHGEIFAACGHGTEEWKNAEIQRVPAEGEQV